MRIFKENVTNTESEIRIDTYIEIRNKIIVELKKIVKNRLSILT